MELYLQRHGEAVESGNWNGGDELRPLTEQGIARLRLQGKILARLRVRPERVMSSPLVRAVQTAEIILEEIGSGKTLEIDDRLAPGLGLGALRLILRENATAASLLVVGHDPDLSRIVGELIGGANIVMKKGGLARLELEDATSPRATLLWLAPPEVLLADR